MRQLKGMFFTFNNAEFATFAPLNINFNSSFYFTQLSSCRNSDTLFHIEEFSKQSAVYFKGDNIGDYDTVNLPRDDDQEYDIGQGNVWTFVG